MGIRKQRKRHGGISDAEEQSHRLFHLYQSDFPGLSFEFKILQPGECEGDLCVSAKTIIDHRGKIRLDQNDGTPVPLDQIPDVLAGKDADMTDGLHLPNTVAALLTDHNKTLHDTLGIDADMVDGYHHDQSLLTTASPQFANLSISSNLSVLSGNVFLDTGNREIKFIEDGQIRCADDWHRIVFMNTSNLMKFFEWGAYEFYTAGSDVPKVVFQQDGKVGILTNSPNALLDVRGDAIFNEDGDNKDFRVESGNKPYMFFVDAGNDIIGIRTSTAHGMLSLAAPDTTIIPWMSVRQDNNEAYGFDFDMERTSIGRLDFYVVNNEVRTHYLSILRSSGRVGIKTTAPTADLDINSDVLRLRTPKTPASSGASGNAGDICWDANYLYICVATNSWRRVAIAGWL